MHEPVIQRLEEYLDGDGPFPEVEEHLRKCEDCKNELDAMRQQSALFRQAFKAEVEPNPAFYARVMGRIETQARVEPLWRVDVCQASLVCFCYVPRTGWCRLYVRD
jgi:anti-sigma factor RsiW